MRIHTTGFPQWILFFCSKILSKQFLRLFFCLSPISRSLIAVTDYAPPSQCWLLAPTMGRSDRPVARRSPTVSRWELDLLLCTMWSSLTLSHRCRYQRQAMLGDPESRIIHCIVLYCTHLHELSASQTLSLNSCKGGHTGIRWKTENIAKIN